MAFGGWQFYRLFIYAIINLMAVLTGDFQLKLSVMGHAHVRHHHGLRYFTKEIADNVTACPIGTYYNDLNGPCLSCSRCGEGLYIAHRCQPFKDTVCDSCHTYMGPHNHDYLQKCSTFKIKNSYKSINASDYTKMYPTVNHRTKTNNTEISSITINNNFFKLNAKSFTLILVATIVILAIAAQLIRHCNRKRKNCKSGYAVVALSVEEL